MIIWWCFALGAALGGLFSKLGPREARRPVLTVAAGIVFTMAGGLGVARLLGSAAGSGPSVLVAAATAIVGLSLTHFALRAA